ncbi:hypothetical protein M2447_001578 [Ereboglobus sp. PH5-10]|uniref:hypothetical protein n=1 Tax=Ereboglobus sp. PH5-10 TaxID=2940629 RepID=UPI002406678A|nr:hypothetical protein [Ereboglobus sp. PH5-10]MDF9827485.1 hypothetical protein [Ereboglobus sp. PH5-10]
MPGSRPALARDEINIIFGIHDGLVNAWAADRERSQRRRAGRGIPLAFKGEARRDSRRENVENQLIKPKVCLHHFNPPETAVCVLENRNPCLSIFNKLLSKDLGLEHLYIVHPGEYHFPLDDKITALPLREVASLAFD